MNTSGDLNAPAPNLSFEETARLLDYGGAVALDSSDPEEVRTVTLELGAHVFTHCRTAGQQRAMLAAMERAHVHRGRITNPWHGNVEAFLAATMAYYDLLPH